jgi:hypothetical protein
MISENDIDFILEVNKNFKHVDFNNDKVLVYARKLGSHVEGEVVTDKSLKRKIYCSIVLRNCAIMNSHSVGLEREDLLEDELRVNLPFINDFERLIRQQYTSGHFKDAVEIETPALDKLLKKYEERRGFYDFASHLLEDGAKVCAIAEHALDMDLKYVYFNNKSYAQYQDPPTFAIKEQEPAKPTFVVKKQEQAKTFIIHEKTKPKFEIHEKK